ncbi:Transcriptional regulator, AraC family [plant metagenome]|uniref:Transcriptional regulator, AraC family n=2 Tax=root TaxID=1 RepID=A0A1C3K3L4_9BURK|nr:AraC family transcriptional regulator [Orrella dioscoreae]SBT25995.1 Transcriptional regulator, AraC family [Orrella dioscoreae]SOE46157.1 Transcriptional regulator, AraC family [Orrella dioscoreae]
MQPADYYREINGIIARYASEDGDGGTAIPRLFVSSRSRPSQALHTKQQPCFVLVTQGAKRLMLGETVIEYGVGDFLVVSLDLPVVSCITLASPEKPLLGLGLAIEGPCLQEVLARMEAPSLPAADTPLGIQLNQAPTELLDATLRLLRLLDRQADIPAMAPLIEQEILYRLLSGPCGATLLRIAATDSPSNKIARAIAWLREHYTDALRIEALAAHVGMSVSSLHHHFSAVTAMTPMQYQKRLRLHEARRLMLIERLDVGSAGYRVGYQSPSQFSREYSRLYGMPPMRDVDRAREQMTGAVAVQD